MQQSATRDGYLSLSTKQQLAIADVLRTCEAHKLSCRCEMTGGRDFTVVVAPGLSAARFWIDRFDIDDPH